MKLIFDQITASYRKKEVLHNVSFSVEQGSITALIGRNGAGKSTLVSCLTGEKNDYSGSILLNGQDLRRMTPGEHACQLACLPQVLPRPHIMVRELIAFGRTPYTPLMGTLSPNDREKIEWAIHSVGLDLLADAFVDELSGGERKKAFFAMTLAQDTPLVVLDEPTAHLDVVSRFEFLKLVEVMRQKTGKTFLIVMHDLPEVLRCANKIVVLHEKQIYFIGSTAECLSSNIPQDCFRVQISGNRATGYAVQPL